MLPGPRSAQTRRGRVLAAAVSLLLLVLVALAGGLPAAAWLSGALVAATSAHLLRNRSRDDESPVWLWSSRGAWSVAAGLAAEAVLRAADPAGTATGLRGWGVTVAAVAACACLYQGMVRWNRSGTELSDPGDWLNGISAFLAALALAALTLAWTSGTGLTGQDFSHLIRLSAVTVLAGSCLTVTAIADLRTDPRALVLTAAALLTGGGEAVVLALTAEAPAGGPADLIVLGVWTLLALAAALAGRMPRGERTAAYASSRATTAGSVVVIAASIGILAANSALRDGSVPVSVLAAAAGLSACVRVLRLVHDLSQLAASRIEARTDSLTGVPNRRALIERLDALSETEDGAALLVIDLDRFKDVNDRYGHAVGDALIQDMAERLAGTLNGRGLLARLGGDEFAVVLSDPDPDRAVTIARELCEAAAVPSETGGRVLRVSASIGVASTMLGEQRDGELLRGADAAMYIAKRSGSGVCVYDRATDAQARTRHELAEELRAMLTGSTAEHGHLTVHFQPQLDAATGRVLAAEALVRWDHPRRGLLGPYAFLDLAEEHGLMTPLTWHVLDQATGQAALWRAAGLDLPVAVNLSTSCLEYPGLLQALEGALDRAGLPPSRLVVEITETTLMHDPRLAVEVTRQIAGLGIAVSIDDYGTGYSSLAYLNDLPAEELKLDRSFTGKLTSDPRTRAIVSGTIELAHHLGLRLVAEGVEDEATLDLLRRLGCDRTQGFLHARPMPAPDFAEWMRSARTVVADA
ncbi:EAL domain-containing protein [Cellulomonas sp. RIT-PI-Y]|uniref:putative bifunctional diguanylate cyclase/phosphodiesterase n=1 Tax=Cellulomonas sp. RIT-PI-Y TaxID=3035297 RepID=UPI0021D8CF0A|nr:EAL domain-containing protein [Cellulomonas sp. RIT-PI-Y]